MLTSEHINAQIHNFPKTALYFQAGAENEARLAQTTPVKSYRLYGARNTHNFFFRRVLLAFHVCYFTADLAV
jgi:hypothetical protein